MRQKSSSPEMKPKDKLHSRVRQCPPLLALAVGGLCHLVKSAFQPRSPNPIERGLRATCHSTHTYERVVYKQHIQRSVGFNTYHLHCLITLLNNSLALFIIRSARTLPETWNPPRLYYGHWVGMDLWCHGLASVPWEWGFPARERQLPFLILSVLPFLIARMKSDVLFGTPVTTM